LFGFRPRIWPLYYTILEAEFLNLDLENDSKESILPAYVAWRPGGPVRPMRPIARGLVQHGGPPGWPEESDPAGVILYVMGSIALLFRTVLVSLTGTAQLRADVIYWNRFLGSLKAAAN
jgi:hypothetical protein